MTTTVAAHENVVTVRPNTRRRRLTLGRFVLPVWSVLVILWLIAPILVMIVFSFNKTTGRTVSTTWNGFTFRWYAHMFASSDLTDALVNSITIGLLTTAISVVLGTLMGVAMGRRKFVGIGSVNLLLFANIAAPEVVLGAALLSLFLTMRIPLGYWTILIAHVMFSVAYVVITVRARMAGQDPSLEEASRDLGAGPVATFVRITLPGIFPGIIAGGLLAFVMSIDDYIITNFNNGTTQTFPLWVIGASNRLGGGVPPTTYSVGSMIFLGGVLLAVGGAIWNRRKA